MLAGGVAGFLSTALLHPLDLVKTRLHVQEDAVGRRLPRYLGLFDAFASILRLEGALGLYQGLWPNLLGNTTSWGIYMFAYNRCKHWLSERRGMEGSSLYLSSATIAGGVTTLMLHPVFTIKTRLQLQMRTEHAAAALPRPLLPASQRDNYAGAMNAVARMVREEGALSLYRGLGPSMLLVSHGSIQFLVYEHAKLELLRRRQRATELSWLRSRAGKGRLARTRTGQRSGGSAPAADEIEAQARDGPWPDGGSGGGSAAATGDGVGVSDATVQLGTTDLLVASIASKAAAVAFTYPYQVVRSCMQQRAVIGSGEAADAIRWNVSATATAGHIWAVDGLAGFYRGLLAHILRSTPQATLTLLIYEHAQRAFTRS